MLLLRAVRYKPLVTVSMPDTSIWLQARELCLLLVLGVVSDKQWLVSKRPENPPSRNDAHILPTFLWHLSANLKMEMNYPLKEKGNQSESFMEI